MYGENITNSKRFLGLEIKIYKKNYKKKFYRSMRNRDTITSFNASKSLKGGGGRGGGEQISQET